MTARMFGSAFLLCVIASEVLAQPVLSVVPEGVQGSNWVWRVDITPDLSLIPDGTGTPLAFELGFRLTGAGLVSATMINPSEFPLENPGRVIFGWEALTALGGSGNCGSGTPGHCPVGLQDDVDMDEVFAAFGSINFTAPGPKPVLQILTEGPLTSIESRTSTIEWLGAYGGKGRIAQISGMSGDNYLYANYDLYAGTATQTVIPEPASALLGLGAIVAFAAVRRQRR